MERRIRIQEIWLADINGREVEVLVTGGVEGSYVSVNVLGTGREEVSLLKRDKFIKLLQSPEYQVGEEAEFIEGGIERRGKIVSVSYLPLSGKYVYEVKFKEKEETTLVREEQHKE